MGELGREEGPGDGDGHPEDEEDMGKTNWGVVLTSPPRIFVIVARDRRIWRSCHHIPTLTTVTGIGDSRTTLCAVDPSISLGNPV